MQVSLGKVVSNQRNSTLSMAESDSETTEWLRVAKKKCQGKDQRCCASSQRVMELADMSCSLTYSVRIIS